MNVLITGGAGFIGSHIADACIYGGHRVCVLDDLSTGRLQNIAHQLEMPRFSFVEGSILDQDLVQRLVAEADVVIHAAAAVGMMLVVDAPLRTFETNVIGSKTVFEAAARAHKRVLFLSTSEIYGLNPEMPVTESAQSLLGSPWKARWSYAYSKAAAEVAAMGYVRQRGAEITVLRLFNTVGRRQRGHYGMVIPRFVEQALRTETLVVHGDGMQTRSFSAVAEIADAIVRLMHVSGISGEPFNLGNPAEISILALAERVLALTGSKSAIRFASFDDVYEPGFEEIMRRVPDIHKIQSVIDFQPKMQIDAILSGVILEHRNQRAAV